jgi:hypothetical protein
MAALNSRESPRRQALRALQVSAGARWRVPDRRSINSRTVLV